MIRWMRATLLACLFAGPVHAAGQAPLDPLQDPLILRGEFLRAHPDLNYRMLGMEALARGRHGEALRLFQRAARHADKPSQAMVAEMLWHGQGAAADRAQAYVWMDLAAERGYPAFIAKREQYWRDLDAAQREAAVEGGRAVYAEYGDKVARPRMAAALRRARLATTGSRTGQQVGNLEISVAGPGLAPTVIEGARFYDPTFWDPDLYQAWHDATWGRRLPPRAAAAPQATRPAAN